MQVRDRGEQNAGSIHSFNECLLSPCHVRGLHKVLRSCSEKSKQKSLVAWRSHFIGETQ